MADLLPNSVAFIDEEASLYVESDEEYAGPVVVNFEAKFRSPDGTLNTVTFSENLTSKPSTLRDPSNAKGKKANRITWKVNINKNDAFKSQTVVLRYTVIGKATTGVRMVSAPMEDIIIGAITVTKNPQLVRIMRQEFAKQVAPDQFNPVNPVFIPPPHFEFDPAPVEQHIATLSKEQKSLLFQKAIELSKETEESKKNRLIAFISVYPRKDLLMNADHIDHRVRPNATFTVFHCFDVLKGGVVVVCHTNFFVLHLGNSVPAKHNTQTWVLQTKQNGKGANQWMAKNNPKPLLWKVATMFPITGVQDDVPWNRVFAPDGKDIMNGNSIHGMINTHGCWMLFRNSKWPKPIEKKCDDIYMTSLRVKHNRAEVIKRLREEAGYNVTIQQGTDPLPPGAVPVPAGASSSAQKFANFDRNFQYMWFFHDLLGIRYFSNRVSDSESGKVHIDRWMNERLTHHHPTAVERAFPLAEAVADGQDNPFAPGQGTFCYYGLRNRQLEDRRNRVPPFQPSDALWENNALGFKPAQGYIPKAVLFGDISKAQLDKCAWADLYVYREDGVDIEKMARDVARGDLTAMYFERKPRS